MATVRSIGFAHRGVSKRYAPTYAVELDADLVIARGLLAYWVFGSNGLVDLCGNVPPLKPQSDARSTSTRIGPGWQHTAFNQALVATIPAKFNITQGTLLWFGDKPSYSSGAAQSFISVVPDNVGGGTTDLYSLASLNSPGYEDFLGYLSQGNAYQLTFAPIGQVKSVAVNFRSGSTVGYIDGKKVATAVTPVPSGFTSTAQVGIGGYPYYSNGLSLGANTSVAAIWNRRLGDAEHRLMSEDPFCMLRPVRRGRFYFATVVVPPTRRPRITIFS